MIVPQTAEDFIPTLQDESVELVLTDPPYFEITKEGWDNQWKSEADYVEWLGFILKDLQPKLTKTGSLVFFMGLGKHGVHPIFDLVQNLERSYYTFRNWITWKKRRAYGKSHDYLYCREEILWFSKSPERTEVTFHIPLLDEKRGYAGFNENYPAKSEFKRVSNVWDDLPELMRPRRACEKPAAVLQRLIATHSNPGDLVVDVCAGTGTTEDAALKLVRRFVGCEPDLTASAFWGGAKKVKETSEEGPQKDPSIVSIPDTLSRFVEDPGLLVANAEALEQAVRLAGKKT
jgi:DNA modification methylase